MDVSCSPMIFASEIYIEHKITNGMNKGNELLGDWEKRFAAYIREHGDLTDGSHDLGHFQRVWKAAQFINREEGGVADELILLAAAYFHDVVALPKNHPQRREASRLSAEETVALLGGPFADFPA